MVYRLASVPCLLLALGWTGLIYGAETTPTATTLNGTYYGIYSPGYNQDFFFGIPFAQPPVGDLRYRAPQPLNTTWTGARNATEIGYECIGYGGAQTDLGNYISEDCLTMNIVKPTGSEGKSLPVAVWIYGGSYASGGNLDPRYNTSFIVEASVEAGTPMIAVAINYRLHGWGFLWSKELQEDGAGNLGLRDQNFALRWINENIASFGGDPTKVTIWGESAGAGSVGAQLLAFGGRDDKLFRAAITESGGPLGFGAYPTLAQHQPVYDSVVKAVGCSNATSSLACLRQVPWESLNTALNSSLTASVNLFPVFDGDFIREPASVSLPAGRFIQVPLLTGTNTDEGTAFGPRGYNDTSSVLAQISTVSSDNCTIATIAALYPDIPSIGIPSTYRGRTPATTELGLQYKRTSAIAGDSAFIAPRRYTSEIWAKWNLTSYSYRFNVLPNGIPATIGVTHFQEVAFVFANTDGEGYKVTPFTSGAEGIAQRDVAKLMSRMWVAFITTGDPNLSGVPSASWPKYSLDAPANFIFDANVTSYVEDDVFRAEAIAYFNKNWKRFGR